MTNNITLGQKSLYPDTYDASLLEPISRQLSRAELGLDEVLPFHGADIWTGYELSWLGTSGKPEVAIAEFSFPAASANIIESKSFKYYLNSFNQTKFDSWEHVQNTLVQDLSLKADGQVEVSLFPLEDFADPEKNSGDCVDRLEVNIDQYSPSPGLLKSSETKVTKHGLYSHLLKSNCPVTGQPDWASVWIEYSGKEISPESFLRYVVSYRQHQDFHENCVERIFCDLLQQCECDELSVYARYTRRGGLDINPFRTNVEREIPFKRVARQ
ncbi:MAG: NADPH-dependent 7-cyano-7-deazaguanine reductase QueF [Agarilytica sp.]